jgi:hypothetical protein
MIADDFSFFGCFLGRKENKAVSEPKKCSKSPLGFLKLFRKPPMTCTSEKIEQWERWKAGTEILIRLSEQFLELVKVFIEAGRTLYSFFLFN